MFHDWDRGPSGRRPPSGWCHHNRAAGVRGTGRPLGAGFPASGESRRPAQRNGPSAALSPKPHRQSLTPMIDLVIRQRLLDQLRPGVEGSPRASSLVGAHRRHQLCKSLTLLVNLLIRPLGLRATGGSRPPPGTGTDRGAHEDREFLYASPLGGGQRLPGPSGSAASRLLDCVARSRGSPRRARDPTALMPELQRSLMRGSGQRFGSPRVPEYRLRDRRVGAEGTRRCARRAVPAPGRTARLARPVAPVRSTSSDDIAPR